MSELQSIRGIGNTVEEKLNKIGITNPTELSNANPDTLSDAGVRSPQKLIDRVEIENVTIQTGAEVEEEQQDIRYISSGLDDVDNMLNGGFEGGFLIGISGEHKAGKTQFALQALASAADYTDDAAIYIETEPNRFHVNRVKSLCEFDESYKQIHKIAAHSSEADVDNLDLQRNSYDALRDHFDDVSMIVVDSFVANFRLSGKFSSRADLPERNTIIADHLQGLQSLSNHYDCPVLMTLQVMGNPDPYSGGGVSVWGSLLMDHTITYLLHMAHGQGELKEAHLKGHPAIADNEITLKIPEDAPLETV